MPVDVRTVGAMVLLLTGVCPAAFAQNWSFDARTIGMGSPRGEHLGTTMIEQEREYRSIVLPFGLLQVLRDLDALNPTNDRFDLVRAIEYGAAPLHYTFGRSATNSGNDFVVDIRNATLSRDLNRYRGFVPAPQPRAEGLANPSWGKTVKLRKGADGGFQGVFLGAGPYVSMQTDLAIDPQLTAILGSPAPAYVGNAHMRLGTQNLAQLALAVTGGYRGRFSWRDAGSPRDGLYVAANYSHLHGMRYEQVDVDARLDTDRAGLLTVDRQLPPPVQLTRVHAEAGRGRAVDVGVGAVIGGWELGAGVSGIANQLTWRGVRRTGYVLDSLFGDDAEFEEGSTTGQPDRQIALPVTHRWSASYRGARSTTTAEAGNGLGGPQFRAGYEHRFGVIDVRGGGTYARELWSPTAGVGLHLGRRLAVDVAVYANAANVERRRNAALATSLRFMH